MSGPDAATLVLAEALKIEAEHDAATGGPLDVFAALEGVGACLVAAHASEGVAEGHAIMRCAAWALVALRIVRGEATATPAAPDGDWLEKRGGQPV